MVLAVMRAFGGYTIDKIMGMPFYHLVKLFELAEKADALDSLSFFTGRSAGYDKNVAEPLIEVKRGRTVKDKSKYNSIVTEEAKRQADRYAGVNSK